MVFLKEFVYMFSVLGGYIDLGEVVFCILKLINCFRFLESNIIIKLINLSLNLNLF